MIRSKKGVSEEKREAKKGLSAERRKADSSPLERGRGYFEESGPKLELFSEKEQRGRRGKRERERETDAAAYANKRRPQP